MKKAALCVALASALGACGGSDSGSNGASDASRGGGTTPSGTFVGSCKIVTSTTLNGSTTSSTGCTDYFMETAATIEKLCQGTNHQNEIVTIVATYSPEPCSHAGMAAKCTSSTVIYYRDDAKNGDSACSAQGGTWSLL